MKTRLLVIFLIIISFKSYCQINEYLVKHNGDTLWGKIKLMHNVFSVSGKNNIEINAKEVKILHSSKYKGSTVVQCNLQLYTENLVELERDWVNVIAKDTVMIIDEIYSTPKMNLYFGTDNMRVPYYFYKLPTDVYPVQLVVRYHLSGGLSNYGNNPAALRGDRSRTHLVEDKGYVNQLMAIMNNCSKISEGMWEILSYRDYSLKQLIKKYNKCK